MILIKSESSDVRYANARVCVRQYLVACSVWRLARYLCRLPPVLYALIWHATLFPDVQGGLRASHDTARLAVTYKAHALSCLHWYSLYLNCDRNVIAQSASTIQMTACDITMRLFISLCGCGRLHTTATMRRESPTDSLLHHHFWYASVCKQYQRYGWHPSDYGP